MSKPSKNSKSLAIVVTGITTTILTGIFLGQLQASTGFSLYLFSFFFIIPVGAIFTGVVATSGYFIGAYFFQAKTGKNLGFWILLSATLVYLIANYMVYNSHQEDGVFVRDIISFWHYLHLSITHTQMKFGRSVNPVTLGLLGYLYAFLYFVGFACGSFFSSLILSSI
jgi:hypothetical protein